MRPQPTRAHIQEPLSQWWSWTGPWACGPESTWAWVQLLLLCRGGRYLALTQQVAGRAHRCFGVFCSFFCFVFRRKPKVNAHIQLITPAQ